MMEHGRDASQKAELRERIIMTATEAFTLKGIKCITMDDIAAALGISKRTLYEVFADKESLLKECILQKQAERGQILAGDIRAIQQCAGGDTCCLSEKHRDLSSDQQALLRGYQEISEGICDDERP